MILADYFNKLQIRGLQDRFGEIAPEQVEKDYRSYFDNPLSLVRRIVDRVIPLDYGLAVINSIEENVFKRLSRTAYSIFDAILS